MILDIGCGRKKYPGSIGIDMSPAGQADVLCDSEEDVTFRGQQLRPGAPVHIIEEVDDIFRMLGEAHRVAKPGARVVIMTPHYTDHASYCSPAHRWHLRVFLCGSSAINPRNMTITLPRNIASGRCEWSCSAFGGRWAFSS